MNKDNLELSRRKLIAGLGTAGVAAAGAGLGTTAYLSDTESFDGNSMTAGELNLIVDWYTDVDQGSATPDPDTASGTLDGNPGEYTYEVADVKPGDSGTLAFCPKIVDNPAWLWIGSEDGVTDYENGLTEPEGEVDDSGGDPGEGNGELSENVEVTVSYAGNVEISEGEVVCEDTTQLGEGGRTLADLSSQLESGVLVDPDFGDEGPTAYPASPDAETQNGPCFCVEWEVPTSVGNEIQSDSFTIDFSLVAMQQRHNPGGSGENPFNGTQAQ